MTKGQAPRSGRRRGLTADEVDLWRQVTRTVRAMRNIPTVETMQEMLAPGAPGPAPGAASILPAKPAPPQAPQRRPSAPPLAQIEPRLRQRLRRGRSDVDGAIDLHGLRQAEAHQRLRSFLSQAQRDGAKLVLVITGKGRGAEDMHEQPFGVLRRSVPQWLREADMRALVIGFEEATATHGGTGALYVRVRRVRPHGERQ